MSLRKLLLTALVVCCALFGCATTNDPTTAAQPSEEGVYRTGSRIPSRGPAPPELRTISRDEWENTHQTRGGRSGGGMTQ
jgi:hypothetical protein